MKSLTIMSLIATVLSASTLHLAAAEFKLVRRFGKPIADRDKASKGRILYASWIDDDSIVFTSDTGDIRRLSARTGRIAWTIENPKPVGNWSFSRGTKRLVYSVDCGLLKTRIQVVDCSDGKTVLNTDSNKMGRLLSDGTLVPGAIALTPNDGRLLICDASYSYGRNGYVLDASYRKVVRRFRVDTSPDNLSMSPDGRYLSLTGHKKVLSVLDLKKDRDVFFRGKRIVIDPKTLFDPKTLTGRMPPLEITIDTPFYSHIHSDGSRTVVYSEDEPQIGTGRVFVHDLSRNTVKQYDARNGHIEMDVDFKKQRIVLTGTSTDLTLVGFDGKEIIHAKGITKQRNLCVEFSPSGKYVLVGSWDNTLSVFQIAE